MPQLTKLYRIDLQSTNGQISGLKMNFTDDIESEWLPSCQNKEINNLEVEPEKRIAFVGMIVTD